MLIFDIFSPTVKSVCPATQPKLYVKSFVSTRRLVFFQCIIQVFYFTCN